MDLINQYINEKQFNVAFLLSKIYKDENDVTNNGDFKNKFLTIISNIDKDLLSENELELLFEYSSKPKIRVLLLCDWCDSYQICNLWNKMSKNNDYKWNNIQIVWEEPYDYYCIINKPYDDNIQIEPKKTIIFRMEPNMETTQTKYWGDKWINPSKDEYKFVGYHNEHYNNNEWHLSKTYNQLTNEKIEKNRELDNILSTILSDKYYDPGHKKRIDFVKFLENKNFRVDVYGQNKFEWKNYKGSLPSHQKENSLFPYKYVFNCENHSIKNYFTEKLIDGILSECLVFYSGHPNVKEYIDERAFVYLELEDFEKDYEIIKKAMNDNWWSIKLPFIRKEKEKILNELQFFPRLCKIINET
jgi:hypothetical protein